MEWRFPAHPVPRLNLALAKERTRTPFSGENWQRGANAPGTVWETVDGEVVARVHGWSLNESSRLGYIARSARGGDPRGPVSLLLDAYSRDDSVPSHTPSVPGDAEAAEAMPGRVGDSCHRVLATSPLYWLPTMSIPHQSSRPNRPLAPGSTPSATADYGQSLSSAEVELRAANRGVASGGAKDDAVRPPILTEGQDAVRQALIMMSLAGLGGLGEVPEGPSGSTASAQSPSISVDPLLAITPAKDICAAGLRVAHTTLASFQVSGDESVDMPVDRHGLWSTEKLDLALVGLNHTITRASALALVAESRRCRRREDRILASTDTIGWLTIAALSLTSAAHQAVLLTSATAAAAACGKSQAGTATEASALAKTAMNRCEATWLAVGKELASHGLWALAARNFAMGLQLANPRSLRLLEALATAVVRLPDFDSEAPQRRSRPDHNRTPTGGGGAWDWKILSPRPFQTLGTNETIHLQVDVALLDPLRHQRQRQAGTEAASFMEHPAQMTVRSCMHIRKRGQSLAQPTSAFRPVTSKIVAFATCAHMSTHDGSSTMSVGNLLPGW